MRGHPEPQVTWYRDGKAVIGGDRCVVKQGGRGTFSLAVGGVREEDFGCYTCQATNEAGSRQVTVEILLEGSICSSYTVSRAKITADTLPARITPVCTVMN